jgi:photosystem II stability/assembly factor-like uncharacterized protein
MHLPTRAGFIKSIKSIKSIRGCVFFSCLIGFGLLPGCEAKLNLSGVEKELGKSVVRTDQYQEMVLNQGTLILVGSQGLVLTSEDEGVNWERRVVEGRPNFIGLSLCPDNSVLALSFDRRIWKSADKGRTWAASPIDTDQEVQDICCAPDGTIWVTGSFTTLLHSADGGKSWETTSLGEDALLTYISFFNETTGIVAGEFGMFFKTVDGGQNWESQGKIGADLYPLAVYFKDERTGWVGGLSGVLMKTVDGGATWTDQESGVAAPLYNFIGDGTSLYALGDQVTVLALKGDRWHQLETPNIPVYLRAGHIRKDGQLLAAGGWGVMLTLAVN